MSIFNDPQIKTDFVAALRSGEYRQTKKYLRRGDCFCALGVLCDVAAKHGMGQWTPNADPAAVADVDIRTAADVYAFSTGMIGDGLRVSVLPLSLQGKLFVDGAEPLVAYADSRYVLHELNDMGVGFDVIADLVEEQL